MKRWQEVKIKEMDLDERRHAVLARDENGWQSLGEYKGWKRARSRAEEASRETRPLPANFDQLTEEEIIERHTDHLPRYCHAAGEQRCGSASARECPHRAVSSL